MNEEQLRRITAHLAGEEQELLPEDSGEEQERLRKAWNLASQYRYPESQSANWEALEARLNGNKQRWEGNQRFLTISLSIAASVALLAAAYFTFWYRAPKKGMETALYYNAAYGEQRQVPLPDGSAVTLNSGSSIWVEPGFNKEQRRIELHGEAYFNVQKSSLPFVVKAGKAQISVLGTAFNVREGKSLVRVDVARGRVRVEAGSEFTELNKGQAAALDLSTGQLSALPGDSLSWAWKQGVLVFRSEALSEVVSRLEQHYNVRISMQPDWVEKRYTGRLEPMPVHDALKLINAALGVSLKAEAAD
ncbi:MAG: FecR domain-containing protein [Bacteroidetes bacterium]|nr:FecR domain-containing protein [Bacteroidota bacterium]